MLLLKETSYILIQISSKFVSQGPTGNKIALVQIIAWCQLVTTPLSEPMLLLCRYALSGHNELMPQNITSLPVPYIQPVHTASRTIDSSSGLVACVAPSHYPNQCWPIVKYMVDTQEHISMRFCPNSNILVKKCIWNCHLHNIDLLFKPECGNP